MSCVLKTESVMGTRIRDAILAALFWDLRLDNYIDLRLET